MTQTPDTGPLPLPSEGGTYELVDGQLQLQQQTVTDPTTIIPTEN